MPRKHSMLVCLAICLTDQIERVQKRALRILYPELSSRKGLADANLMSLYERREHWCITLFNEIIESDGQHKLAGVLPAQRQTIHAQFKEQANIFQIINTYK